MLIFDRLDISLNNNEVDASCMVGKGKRDRGNHTIKLEKRECGVLAKLFEYQKGSFARKRKLVSVSSGKTKLISGNMVML